jgi:hypothetical protein
MDLWESQDSSDLNPTVIQPPMDEPSLPMPMVQSIVPAPIVQPVPTPIENSRPVHKEENSFVIPTVKPEGTQAEIDKLVKCLSTLCEKIQRIPLGNADGAKKYQRALAIIASVSKSISDMRGSLVMEVKSDDGTISFIPPYSTDEDFIKTL